MCYGNKVALPGEKEESRVKNVFTKFIVIAAVILAGIGFNIALAQETMPPSVEETEYSYGTVVSASNTQLVVREDDYNTGNEIEVTYILDPKLEVNNVASVKDIAAGDSVEIEYLVKDANKTALVIDVEKAEVAPKQ